MKATLDAAGLQCSEVESDTSKQVFTGLQLNHETGILSLEASRTWRLRLGLVFAAPKTSYWRPGAKLIGHITWSCLLRRPAASLVNARYRFARTFGPRSGRVWPAVAQEFRWIASPLLNCDLASPWSPWVCATGGYGGTRGGCGVTRRRCDPEDVAAAGSCAERWRFSAGEFISARRSVLVESERKAHKALWLGIQDVHEENRVDLHPSLVRSMRESFQSLPYFSPSLWRKPLEILRGEGKAVMGLRHACRSTETAPQTSTTRVAKSVSSLSCHVHRPCLQMHCVRT